MTSGYLKTANYARKATWAWHVITLFSFVGLIWFAYQAFLPSMNGTTSWESLAGRVFLALTVGVLAAYAARQADKYLDIERRNRKLALEFEALGPYLAPLPTEKQNEFRLKLADLSFGKEDPMLRRGDKSPASIIDLFTGSKQVEQLAKVVADMIKEKKVE